MSIAPDPAPYALAERAPSDTDLLRPENRLHGTPAPCKPFADAGEAGNTPGMGFPFLAGIVSAHPVWSYGQAMYTGEKYAW